MLEELAPQSLLRQGASRVAYIRNLLLSEVKEAKYRINQLLYGVGVVAIVAADHLNTLVVSLLNSPKTET
jgi:hypothetical protein